MYIRLVFVHIWSGADEENSERGGQKNLGENATLPHTLQQQ